MTPLRSEADGDDVAGSAAEHLAGFLTDREEAAARHLDGDHGRLTEDDAAPGHVDDDGCGAQVDAEPGA